MSYPNPASPPAATRKARPSGRNNPPFEAGFLLSTNRALEKEISMARNPLILKGLGAIAAAYGISQPTASKLIHQNVIPAQKLGNAWVMSTVALARHLDMAAAPPSPTERLVEAVKALDAEQRAAGRRRLDIFDAICAEARHGKA
jgi:hypothetical protein